MVAGGIHLVSAECALSATSTLSEGQGHACEQRPTAPTERAGAIRCRHSPSRQGFQPPQHSLAPSGVAPAAPLCRRDRRAAAKRYRAAILALSLALTLSGADPGTAPDVAALPVIPPALEAVDLSLAPAGEGEGDIEEVALAPSPFDEDGQTAPGVPETVLSAIRHARDIVGADVAYLMAVAARESRFDPAVRARQTTAAGLYQFTEDTWLRVVKLFGARHGLEDYARRIVVDKDGAIAMRDAKSRAALLQLRDDPRLSALMAAELGRDNKLRLERILGRTVSPAETYLAHLLGIVPAARIIVTARSAPQTSAAGLLPTAARTNPGMFAPDGRAASAGAIVATIKAYFDRLMPGATKIVARI